MTTQDVQATATGHYLAPIRGIGNFFGEHDSGKTWAAIGACGDPSKVLFIDSDLKGRAVVNMVREASRDFGAYHDLTSHFAGDKPTVGFFPRAEAIVKEIKQDDFDLVVWDNWNPVYESLRAIVDNNPGVYKHILKLSPNSKINMGLVSKIARRLEEGFLLSLAAKAKLVIVTHHFKDRYENGQKVGRVPEASKLFDRVCSMRAWLKHNPNSPVPIMLFLKRPSIPRFVTGEDGVTRFQPLNILPMRAVPLPTEHSVWDVIDRYWKEPADLRPPTRDETASADEIAMMRGYLTEEQKDFLRIALALSGVASNEDAEYSAPVVADTSDNDSEETLETLVLELAGQGKNVGEIWNALKADGFQVAPPQITAIINNAATS